MTRRQWLPFVLQGAALSALVWMLAHVPAVPLEATYTPTPVKSMTAISTSTTQSVSVNASNSVLVYNGIPSGGNPSVTSGYGTITSGSTITVTGGTQTWKGYLVEFIPQFVKSQGCGSITIAGDSSSTSNTATVSPTVTTAKTLVAYTGFTSADTNGNNFATVFATVALTAGNQMTATVANASSTARTIGYCYVEFN